MILERENALLWMQLALLGEVSASLRAVTIRFSADHLHFDAYFDGPIDEVDVESMSCVETELMAAFPCDVTVTHSLFRIDGPTCLPKTDIFVYLRRE